VSKLAGEGYCCAFAASHDLTTIALRFSNVYGSYSFHKGSVIAAFIKQLLNNEQPSIYGDGNQTRDFIHAFDIAQAVYLALTSSLNEDYSLFQVGTGTPTTINDLYTMITKVLQQHGINGKEAVYTPARAGEIYDNYCDISKARQQLGFKPQYALEQGIQNTISWFIDQI
jgi:UDP-glucose 4-epimerase